MSAFISNLCNKSVPVSSSRVALGCACVGSILGTVQGIMILNSLKEKPHNKKVFDKVSKWSMGKLYITYLSKSVFVAVVPYMCINKTDARTTLGTITLLGLYQLLTNVPKLNLMMAFPFIIGTLGIDTMAHLDMRCCDDKCGKCH